MVGQLRCFAALQLLLATRVGGLRPPNAPHPDEVEDAPFLAVLVRTGGASSPQRISSIKNTWGRDLEENALLVMEPDEACASKYGDNHWKGLTCLEAKSHLRLLNHTDFTWLVVIDDDMYVFVDRLQDTLRRMDPGRAEVYGEPYCGDCGEGRKGFCGGGGYILSRESLLTMVSSGAPVSRQAGEAFVEHMMQHPNSGWCDVRFGCVAQDKGLELVGVKGLYGNGIQVPEDLEQTDVAEEKKVVQLTSTRVGNTEPPLVFHKMRDDEHVQRVYAAASEMKNTMDEKTLRYTRGGAEGTLKWIEAPVLA